MSLGSVGGRAAVRSAGAGLLLWLDVGAMGRACVGCSSVIVGLLLWFVVGAVTRVHVGCFVVGAVVVSYLHVLPAQGCCCGWLLVVLCSACVSGALWLRSVGGRAAVRFSVARSWALLGPVGAWSRSVS